MYKALFQLVLNFTCTALSIRFELQGPLVVQCPVHRHVAHQQRRHETYPKNAEHDLPHHDEAVPERVAHLVLQRLCQRRYLWDRGVGQVDARSELCEEGGGKPPG